MHCQECMKMANFKLQMINFKFISSVPSVFSVANFDC